MAGVACRGKGIEMKDIIIFGAGAQGRTAAAIYRSYGVVVRNFVDNDKTIQGKTVMGIPVISPENLKNNRKTPPIMICVGGDAKNQIKKQLKELGIEKVLWFNKELLLRKERFLSYAYPTEHEDLILYHVLKNEKQIFWIDIGCNDPDIGSVTKAFYERGHHGINIDIEKEMIEITKRQRLRDINICVGVGKEDGYSTYYKQGDWGGLSTFVTGYRREDAKQTSSSIRITTLKALCDKYVGEKLISFLKIDVEGMEKDVLLGMDFKKYRPKILVIEATLPCTNIPNYEQWENIVLASDYHFVYAHC